MRTVVAVEPTTPTVVLPGNPSFEAWLAERERLDHDRWDELWEGVLHVVPPPGGPHQLTSARLARALWDPCERAGLIVLVEGGMFDPERDDSYRQPDVVVTSVDHLSQRGIEGASLLAVEVRSPRDETWQKLDFYARVGVQELLVVDPPAGALDLLVLDDAGALVGSEPDAGGWFRSTTIPFAFRLVEQGLVLVVDGPDGEVRIPLTLPER